MGTFKKLNKNDGPDIKESIKNAIDSFRESKNVKNNNLNAPERSRPVNLSKDELLGHENQDEGSYNERVIEFTKEWDFSRKSHKDEAIKFIKEKKPYLTIFSASRFEGINNDNKDMDNMKKDIIHFDFVYKQCIERANQ